MKTFLATALREPLVHFIAVALLIFAAYGALNPGAGDRPGRIVVSAAKIEQLAALFAKTWQRPPTATELKGLIDDHVKEEITYREALALGLDKDDTVIRRRLRQKLEFIASADVDPQPTEAELLAHLERNAAQYASEPVISFTQIYFDRERHGARLNEDIAAALALLRKPVHPAAQELGDVTLLPHGAERIRLSTVSRDFGADFAGALLTAETGRWTGPLASSFGQHLVLVSERQPAQPATLDQVRAAVLRDMMDDRRRAREARYYGDLLKRYEVIIATPSEGPGQRADAK